MRQSGVYTEGNMLPACRGAGSQSPWSDAGRSKELRPTNRRPTRRATVPYRVRLFTTVPYQARFSWARCTWMCPASRSHCTFVLRLKTVKTVPYRFNTASALAGSTRHRGAQRESEKDLIPPIMVTPLVGYRTGASRADAGCWVRRHTCLFPTQCIARYTEG